MAERPCGCPEIDAGEWEGVEHDLSHLAFFTRPVKYLFGSPIGFENQALQAADDIQKRGYVLAEPLFVLEKPGRFSGLLLVGILPPSDPDPALVSFAPTTKFIAKVYRRKEASYDAGMKAFLAQAKEKHTEFKSIMMWHVGCPRCIQASGYTTIFLGELAG